MDRRLQGLAIKRKKRVRCEKSSASDALLRALKKSEVRNSCFLTSDFFVKFFGGGEDAFLWLHCWDLHDVQETDSETAG